MALQSLRTRAMQAIVAVSAAVFFATPTLGHSNAARHYGNQELCLLQRKAVSKKTVLERHNATQDLSSMRFDNTTETVPPETIYSWGWCLTGALAFIALATYTYSLLTMRPATEQPVHALKTGGGHCVADVHVRSKEPLQEDIYHLAVSSLLRDAVFVTVGEENLALRISRLLIHLLLVMATIIIQIGVVTQIGLYVTPQAVHDIRDSYDKYEFIMYGSQESHTTLTVNGKHRGKAAYFQPRLFETLDDDLKTQVCNIPFSQPCFFMLVLFIWSLTCTGQIRQCLELAATILFVTPTICHMDDKALVIDGDGNFDGTQEQLIAGITPIMKTVLVTLVFAPWLSLTCFLLWIGCRWFAATNDWNDLVTNAVALEFILLLKDLFYVTLVTERSKRELRNTHVLPFMKQEPAGYKVFFGALVWGIIAMGWVFLYVYHLQAVLPEYRWDVRGTCTKWFATLLAQPG